MEIERVVYVNELLYLYGALLSPTQKEICEDYYSLNLSISEIAENRNISRAAVDDALSKGTKKLEDCEKKLGFAAKNDKLKKLLVKLKDAKSEQEKNRIIKEMEGLL